MRVTPTLLSIAALLCTLPTVANAQQAGAIVGRTTVDSDPGDSKGLRLSLGLGGHAAIGFDFQQTDFDSTRRDRRLGAQLMLDVTGPLHIGSVALTPHVDVGLGATGTEYTLLLTAQTILPVESGPDWRPHAEAGAGVRATLGRLALDFTAYTGIRRRSIVLQIVEVDDHRLGSVFGSGITREHYTSYQVSAMFSF